MEKISIPRSLTIIRTSSSLYGLVDWPSVMITPEIDLVIELPLNMTLNFPISILVGFFLQYYMNLYIICTYKIQNLSTFYLSFKMTRIFVQQLCTCKCNVYISR